ncbi:MAG: hypothetical protein DGJ47_001183, partial [Rickettsiaceae bacterium]
VDIDHEVVEDVKQADCLLITTYRDENENIHEFDGVLKDAADNKIFTLCANPDTIIPNKGIARYCAGYFSEVIEQYGGKVFYTGKPKTPIYEYILKKHSDIKPSRILMIGDTFDTDIKGARDAGIHSALVMTGNCAKFHENYNGMDAKLKAIHKKAKELNMIPTFVTSLV